MSRFLNPSHAGDVAVPNATGQQGNATCGDVVHLAISVQDGLVVDARFRAQGCAMAIASAQALCELVIGSSVTAAATVDTGRLSQVLDGIPPERMGCASIALEALREALDSTRASRMVAGSS